MKDITPDETELLLKMLTEAGFNREIFEQMHFGRMFDLNVIAEMMVTVAKSTITKHGTRTRPTFDYSHITREEEDSHSSHHD